MSAWRKEWEDPVGRVGGGGVLGMGVTPSWTKRLLLANGIVFVLLFILGQNGQQLSAWLGINAGMWWTHAPYVPVWQLLTYGFVHDLLGFGHILFNMLTLYFFGSMVERALGSQRFLVLYFGALLLGGLIHIVLMATGLFGGVVVGASGAIMGVVVAAAMMFPNAQVLFFFIPLPLYIVAGGMVLMDLLMFGRFGSSVAHDVHLAGALFGALYIRMGWYRHEPPAILEMPGKLAAQREQKKVQKSADRQRADEERLDQLLARINREGMSSLSAAEKDFLKQMSKRP